MYGKEDRDAYTALVGKSEGGNPLAILRRK
jgi:hypothetical protein